MDQGNSGGVPQQSGKATGSLIFGILGLACVLPLVGPIIAIVLGHLSHGEIKRSGGQMAGSGLATAGLIMGYLGLAMILLIVPLMAALTIPALSKAKEKARVVNCMNNLKMIGISCVMYSQEHDGKLPPDLKTLDSKQYLNAGCVYLCPSAPNNPGNFTSADLQAGRGGYDYFGAGLDIRKVQEPGNTILAADKPGNHPGGNWINVVFVDGHAEGCEAKDVYEAAKLNGWVVPTVLKGEIPEIRMKPQK